MRYLLLTGLLLTGAACQTIEPAARDLIIYDPQGQPAAWVKPGGRVVYPRRGARDGVVKMLIQSLAQVSQRAVSAETAAAACAPKAAAKKPARAASPAAGAK